MECNVIKSDFLQAQALYICYYDVVKILSLEELAERWSLAHTVAVAAWVVVIVLGIALLLRGDGSNYPVTDLKKVYAAENATFTYPANWTLNDCAPDKAFIELPGTIGSDYKGRQAYPLTIYGTGAFNCVKDRPERLDIYSEQIVASDTPCSITTSTKGERLENGLYMQLQEQVGKIIAAHIKQNSCFAPADTVVLGFAFLDPAEEPGDAAEFGRPGVETDAFLASQQYQDIRALAESIRY